VRDGAQTGKRNYGKVLPRESGLGRADGGRKAQAGYTNDRTATCTRGIEWMKGTTKLRQRGLRANQPRAGKAGWHQGGRARPTYMYRLGRQTEGLFLRTVGRRVVRQGGSGQCAWEGKMHTSVGCKDVGCVAGGRSGLQSARAMMENQRLRSTTARGWSQAGRAGLMRPGRKGIVVTLLYRCALTLTSSGVCLFQLGSSA
jgi:hypothetical protein